MHARHWLMLGSAAILLAACGGSGSGGSGSGGSGGSSGGSFGSGGNLNPLNWFRSDPAEETVEAVNIQLADQRPLVAEVITLVIEPMPGGAIIRATGLPPEQGWHTADLVSETGDAPVDGVFVYSFRAVPPFSATRVSTQQSRELTVALFLSDFDLAGVRQIRVVGARNARVARR